MTIQEYFGDWCRVLDVSEAGRLMKKLLDSKQALCPLPRDVFKAFALCPLHGLRVVIIGQDPYPDIRDGKPTATGVAFANASSTPQSCYSKSLDVLMESVVDFTLPHGNIIFDPSLEKWESQGVLLLNSALSCLAGKPGSHILMWRPFMRSFLSRLSSYDSCLVFVLMGSEAQSFEPYIHAEHNHIIKVSHPSWYARNHIPMPTDLWRHINDILKGHNGYGVEWYEEYKFLNKQEENEEVFYEGNR